MFVFGRLISSVRHVHSSMGCVSAFSSCHCPSPGDGRDGCPQSSGKLCMADPSKASFLFSLFPSVHTAASSDLLHCSSSIAVRMSFTTPLKAKTLSCLWRVDVLVLAHSGAGGRGKSPLDASPRPLRPLGLAPQNLFSLSLTGSSLTLFSLCHSKLLLRPSSPSFILLSSTVPKMRQSLLRTPLARNRRPCWTGVSSPLQHRLLSCDGSRIRQRPGNNLRTQSRESISNERPPIAPATIPE